MNASEIKDLDALFHHGEIKKYPTAPKGVDTATCKHHWVISPPYGYYCILCGDTSEETPRELK